MATESLRTIFGAQGHRKLTCLKCKQFSTTNQGIYSAHFRECSLSTPQIDTKIDVQEAEDETASHSNSPILEIVEGDCDDFQGEEAAAGGHSGQDRDEGEDLSASSPWVVDPLNWGNSVPNGGGEATSSSKASTISASSNHHNAGGGTTNGCSGDATSLPIIRPMFGEESGERYGFREVFKHMFQSNIGGVTMYCCRLCAYQHAVRSRVTKHIRLQHFSKQALTTFNCELCSFTTQHATELEHHRRRHAVNTKVYQCSECEYSTPMQNNFKRHLRRHTASDSYVCTFCTFSSPHEATVKRHALLYHRKIPGNTMQTTAGKKPRNSRAKAGAVAVSSPGQQLATVRRASQLSKSAVFEDRTAGHRRSSIVESASNDGNKSVTSADNAGSVYVCEICNFGFASLRAFTAHHAQHDQNIAATTAQQSQSMIMQDVAAAASSVFLPTTSTDNNRAAAVAAVAGLLLKTAAATSKTAALALTNFEPRLTAAVAASTIVPAASFESTLDDGPLDLSVANGTPVKAPTPVTMLPIIPTVSNNGALNLSVKAVGQAAPIEPSRKQPGIVAIGATKRKLSTPSPIHNSPVSKQARLEQQHTPLSVAAIALQAEVTPVSTGIIVDKTFGCPICSFESTCRNAVIEHLDREHSSNDNSNKAADTTCNLLQPIRCTVYQSVKAECHQSEQDATSSASLPPSSAGAAVQCTVCNYRSCSKENLDKHVAYHEDLKIFKCSACGYRCNWKWDINKHCRVVHAAEKSPASSIVLSIEEARSTLHQYRRSQQQQQKHGENKKEGVDVSQSSSNQQHLIEKNQRLSHRSNIATTPPNSTASSTSPSSCSSSKRVKKPLLSNSHVEQSPPTQNTVHLSAGSTLAMSPPSSSSQPIRFSSGSSRTNEANMATLVDGRQAFYCSLGCSYRSHHRSTFLSHLSNHKIQKKQQLRKKPSTFCRQCSFVAKSKQLAIQHRKLWHKKMPAETSHTFPALAIKSKFCCSVCSVELEANDEMRRHVISHVPDALLAAVNLEALYVTVQ